MQRKLLFCQTPVHPGEMANLAIPLPQRYSCAPLYMPIRVVHGKKAGPCLVVFSVLKGTEFNGMEIVNRLLKWVDPEKIRGTLLAIPVMHVNGLMHYGLMSPAGFDLTNCFPGDEEGSYGERIAHLVTHEVLKRADVCIELQTGGLNHNILPQVYCNFENQRAKSLARSFCTPVVTNVSWGVNRLRQTTEELGLPLLVYQAGEAMRFDEGAIHLGVEGVKNVMGVLDMVDGVCEPDVELTFSRDEDWIKAPKAGVLHSDVLLGQKISEGEKIGSICDPFGVDQVFSVQSAASGIVVGVNTSPLLHEGAAMFKVATFLDDSRAQTKIEAWDKQQKDSYLGG